MLLLDSVEPEKWYKVAGSDSMTVSKILGWSPDTIRRWIRDGLLQAFIKPTRGKRGKRAWLGVRVQGCEIIRFAKANLSELAEHPKLRVRIG
jgi:hypothetical protein